MITEVLANTGEVVDHREAQAPQGAAGPTPESMSSWGDAIAPALRMIWSPSTTNCSAAFDHDPGRPCALKHQAQGVDIGLHSQVQTMARRTQVGQGRADANAVRVVHGERPHAAGLRMVHVRIMGEVSIETGLIEGGLRGLPGVAWMAPHGQGAVTAMHAAAPEIHVGFHLAKVRQNLRVGPLVVAPLRPLVVVLRGTTQDDLTVDGTGATDRFATRHQHGFRLMGIGYASKRPVVGQPGRRRCCSRISNRREDAPTPDSLDRLPAATPSVHDPRTVVSPARFLLTQPPPQ